MERLINLQFALIANNLVTSKRIARNLRIESPTTARIDLKSTIRGNGTEILRKTPIATTAQKSISDRRK